MKPLSEYTEEQEYNSPWFNIDEIPEADQKAQYIDIKYNVEVNENLIWPFFKKLKKTKQEAITVFTEPIDKIKYIIENGYNFKNWQFKSKYLCNKIEIAILVADINENEYYIITEMNKLGWFYSRKIEYQSVHYTWKELHFNPAHQSDVSDIIRKEYRYLYHITPSKNISNIDKHGLICKSDNKVYKFPPRIYLIKGNADKLEILGLGKELWKANPKSGSKFTILQIALNRLNKDIKIFYDPIYKYGLYVEENIPKDVLSIIDKYDYSDKY